MARLGRNPLALICSALGLAFLACGSGDSGSDSGPSPQSCQAGCPREAGTLIQRLAIGLGSAVDERRLYVGDSAGVLRSVCKTSGRASSIAEIFNGVVYAVAVDATGVYFGTVQHDAMEAGGGRVWKSPLDGAVEPQMLVDGVDWVVDIALDETHVYWLTQGSRSTVQEPLLPNGTLQRLPKTGGTAEILARNLANPIALALDETHVYISLAGETDPAGGVGIRRVGKGGGELLLVNSTVAARHLVLDGPFVYFTAGGLGTGSVHRVPKVGGAIDRTYDSGLRFVGDLAVDDGQLYYVSDTGEEGALAMVGVESGSPIVLRDDLDIPGFVSLDPCAVYVSTRRTVEVIER